MAQVSADSLCAAQLLSQPQNAALGSIVYQDADGCLKPSHITPHDHWFVQLCLHITMHLTFLPQHMPQERLLHLPCRPPPRQ